MALVKNPILFSKYFNINPSKIAHYGLIDPFLNVDTPLFIDPILLSKSDNKHIRIDATEAFRKHFDSFIRLLLISSKIGDTPWRAAQKQLNLKEPPENGLGYGGKGRSGSSRPDHIRDAIMKTAKEIIDLGSRDPEMISLMGFFEEGVGPDTISDFTTRAIARQLEKITYDFCSKQKIPTKLLNSDQEFELPCFSLEDGLEKSVILVPRDIVRDLPVANSWQDVEAAAASNQRIRDRVNSYLSGITKPTVSDRKVALRSAALESAEMFEIFLAAIKEAATHYDINEDAFNYYKLRSILSDDKAKFQKGKSYDFSTGIDSIKSMVLETIDIFKHHIEKGNLWEELWVGGSPKLERAAQLIYYAMADCFCIANDIDISPEANMGGGPIDFKFSKGYNARVLVEMKRSSGSVKHGYEKQLEYYKEASKTFHGIYVVIDFGDIGNKLAQIMEIRDKRVKLGLSASEIVVIDATRKASASKRK